MLFAPVFMALLPSIRYHSAIQYKARLASRQQFSLMCFAKNRILNSCLLEQQEIDFLVYIFSVMTRSQGHCVHLYLYCTYSSICCSVPPSPPRDLTIIRTGLTAITLSWNTPSWYGNAEQVLYEVSIYQLGNSFPGRGPVEQSLHRVDNRSHVHFSPPSSYVSVISNLKVNTRYGFLVRSRNRAGASANSDYIQTRTLPDGKR